MTYIGTLITRAFKLLPFLALWFASGCTTPAAPFLEGASSLATGGGDTSVRAVPRGPEIEIETTTLISDRDANTNTALPVAFVVTYDQTVLVKLMTLTARQFFLQEEQLKADFPNVIEVWRWEMVPGNSLNNQPTRPGGDDPVGAVVYADYQTPGVHRKRVGAGNQLRIHLKRDNFFISTREG